MNRGDLWIVGLERSAGHKQQGTPPVLIVSPAGFNNVTKTPVALPITTGGGYARRHGFAVSLEQAGTQRTGVMRCDQPRALDINARQGRNSETVPRHIVDDVLARLATVLE